MMKPLRKKHLQIWMLFAVLIPAGIIGGYRAIQKQEINRSLGNDQAAQLPVIINDAETKDYSVYLRSSADGKNYQLQWENRKTGVQLSSLIYMERNGERELVGRVSGTGTYYFPLKADTLKEHKFILYDIIHQQVTDSLIFIR